MLEKLSGTKVLSAVLQGLIVAGGMTIAVAQEQPELDLIKGGTWLVLGVTLVVSISKDLQSSMRDSRK
jgi:hypothetical protein